MKSRSMLGVAILAAAVSLPPAETSGHNYLPLNVGNHWTYQRPGGDLASMEMIGLAVIRGRTTTARRQLEPDQEYENYWTRDAAGNVHLHGARNFTFPVAWAYDPPILMIAPPLSVGQSWQMTFDVFNIDSGLHEFGPNDIGWEVVSAGMIPVPLGSLYAYGIAQAMPISFVVAGSTSAEGAPASAATFDVLGRRLDSPGGPEGAGAAMARDWYTNGIGVARYGASDQYPDRQFGLLSYSTAVPVASATWSRIKNLLR